VFEKYVSILIVRQNLIRKQSNCDEGTSIYVSNLVDIYHIINLVSGLLFKTLATSRTKQQNINDYY
jgi:hypothetical protein